MAAEDKGRRDNSRNRFENTIVPMSGEQAMLQKQDEIIALLKDLGEKLDLDGGVADTDFRATLTDDLKDVKLN